MVQIDGSVEKLTYFVSRGDGNLKEGLNGTKAERRKFEGYDESNIMYPYIILDNSDLQNQINRQISEAIIAY